MELAAAVAAYALQDGIKNLLAEKINLTMYQYEKNEEATFAIDFMQSRVSCPITFRILYKSKMILRAIPFKNACRNKILKAR